MAKVGGDLIIEGNIIADNIPENPVESASNVGAGNGVFKQQVDTDLQFKTLIAGTNISIVNNTNDLTISSSGSSSSFYLSSIGTGARILKANFSDHSDIRSITAGTGIQVSQNVNDISIINAFYLNNAGTGNPLIVANRGDHSTLRTLVAGSNITITKNANNLTIASTGGGGGLSSVEDDPNPTLGGTLDVNGNIISSAGTGTYIALDDVLTELGSTTADINLYTNTGDFFIDTFAGSLFINDEKPALTASNVGTGETIFLQKTNYNLEFKSIVAGDGIVITDNGNDLTVEATGEGAGIQFAESQSGGFSETSSVLKFDSQFFYLSSGGDGNPIVSLNDGRVFLGTFTATNQATLDINSVITNRFENYEFVYSLKPVTDDVILRIRTSTNNGSSFDAGSSDYKFAGASTTLSTPGALASTAAAHISILGDSTAADSIGNGTGERGTGKLELLSKGDNVDIYPTFIYNGSYITASSEPGSTVGGANRISFTPINAIQFFFESGNIASGKVKVYGIS